MRRLRPWERPERATSDLSSFEIAQARAEMVFSLGFIWILIDQDRQEFHDKIASTYVVE